MSEGSNVQENRQKIAHLLQMRAMYEMTTKITKKCFESCVPKINPRMEDSESVCLTNCATNYLKMKMMMAQQLIASIEVQTGNEIITDPQDMQIGQ